MIKLSGLIAAPFTPFDDKGELALKTIGQQVRTLENNGVSGAFICGSTGEGVSLTHEEKKQVMIAWGAEQTTLKRVFMLGGTCLKEMQELAILSKAHKMDAVSILCPYYFKPSSVERLVDFCAQVAATVPEMPFYYYHIPVLTGGNYSMLKFLELADTKIPNLAGIKYTAPDIFAFQRCRAYKNGKYQLLWGTDEALHSGLAAGAAGFVGSTYNYASPLYLKLIDAYNKGDFEEARMWQDKSVKTVEVLVKYGGNEAGKAFMKLIGLDCGWCRPPMAALSEEQLEEMEKDLKTIGFFDFCSQV
jgi:N-acetylneuraminate lyase